MLPRKRKRNIVELVSEQGGCSVTELSDHLEFSKPTIRRDLRELEQEGLIERSHGGALPITSVGNEQAYNQKEVQNLKQKRAIAALAVKEIQDGQVVFFDSGTTTMEVAKQAPTDGTIMSVTNSPLLALELESDDNIVKLTGGTLRRRTKALVGPTAESFMSKRNFDLLILGTNALGLDSGLTTPNEDEAKMKKLMIDQSARVVLVADETKLEEESFARFGGLADIDVFITDGTLPDDYRAAMAENTVEVIENA